MPFAELADVRLFFTDEGDGPLPLLFVHGFSADSNDWIWQLPHFASSHRVIAVDLRGHGRSSAPASGYAAEQFAADLVALLDLLGLPRVVAIGHSMGGIVSSVLAVEHPDRVAALVAVDPAYLLPDELTSGVDEMLESLTDDEVVPFVQGLIAAMESPARTAAMRTWQVRRIAGMEPHVLRLALAAQLSDLVVASRSEPYLRRRTCPVLSLYADPARGPAEIAVQTVAGSKVVTWEGAGHWLQQERPDEFNHLVCAWLATLT